MRFLKLVFISAIVLFVAILLISLLLPSHIRISRAIDIGVPAGKVRPLITGIQEWEKWNEYIKAYHNRVAEPGMMKADEIAIFITAGKDSLVSSEWIPPSGDKFGSGFATIDNKSGQSCTVQWYFDFHIKWYPWKKFQSIVYDQQLGPVMEKSLANLKRIAENSN